MPDHTMIETKIRELVLLHDLACEQLTSFQLAEAIRQALACGDFIRQVVAGSNAQNVIYIPFAEEEKLRTRIKYLEDKLREHGIPIHEPHPTFDESL